MERLHRKERVAAILKILSDNPNKVISLGYFSDLFSAARSTISEDVMVVKQVLDYQQNGVVETISGAAGGVKYIPSLSAIETKKFIEGLCETLKSPERIIPGGFIYMNDIIYSPEIANNIGIIFGKYFYEKKPDYVITVETKGIPIAMMTARALNIPLIIVRHDSRVTEGSTVSINYLSGSSKRMQTMSLSKRCVKKGSRCIFIDDFMKAGGTANGIIDLVKEFESTVVGIGVMVEAVSSHKRLVEDYVALMKLENVDEEEGVINIYPSEGFWKNFENFNFFQQEILNIWRILLSSNLEGGVNMQITDVRVRKITNEGKMKAIVSVTFDNEFVVHDIKVIDGQNGLFIAMPSRKTPDGEFKDIAHPINTETREKIQSAILSEYEKARNSSEAEGEAVAETVGE